LATSCIKHWFLSGYSNILPRIKLGVTGLSCPEIGLHKKCKIKQKKTRSFGITEKEIFFHKNFYSAPLELTGKSVCIFYYDVAPTGQEE